MLYSRPECQSVAVPMEFRPNKPLRNLGIYTLRDKTLILWKRSNVLSFLFSEHNWRLHGPVDYRVSHGAIYQHGRSTNWTDEDLFDTGTSVRTPGWILFLDAKDE